MRSLGFDNVAAYYIVDKNLYYVARFNEYRAMPHVYETPNETRKNDKILTGRSVVYFHINNTLTLRIYKDQTNKKDRVAYFPIIFFSSPSCDSIFSPLRVSHFAYLCITKYVCGSCEGAINLSILLSRLIRVVGKFLVYVYECTLSLAALQNNEKYYRT